MTVSKPRFTHPLRFSGSTPDGDGHPTSHRPMVDASRRHLLCAGSMAGLLGLAGATAPLAALADDPTDYEKMKARGTLRVAVYRDFAPYHDNGRGIDVDLADAIARRMGLKLSLLPFDADENMNDDLRNMVWKGHYLGYGPADVMIHVPYDRALMQENPRVMIFGPYHRETVKVAYDLKQIPTLDSLSPFASLRIGVDGTSVSAMVLASADNGRYARNLAVYRTPAEAMLALRRGEIPAVMAHSAEVESGVSGDARFGIAEIPVQGLPPKGWAVGFAVKKTNMDIARDVQAALDDMLAKGEVAAIFRKHGVALKAP